MEIIVQKFGGTSVATKEMRDNVAEIVSKKKLEGYCPVVIVSAIGRKGAPYATDTLIETAREINSDIESRELDLIMSCGEVISSVLLVNHIKTKGIKSVALTGAQAGIITDGYYGNAEVIKVMPDKILKYLQQDIVPVIAGFQGISEEGDITTLGRGGSDTTASIIGEALKSKCIEIYTDVDGIMTADPRLVPNAKIIPQISYHEVFQMAEQGAKVIHPKAVQIAMRSNIPIAIKNVLSPSEGTYITHCRNYRTFNPSERIISGVAHIPNRVQVFIKGLRIDDVEFFDMLADNKISIDLINIFEESKIFTVNQIDDEKLQGILKGIDVDFEIIRDCTKISVIGDRMRGVPGIMSKIVRALARCNVKILQTADSHTTISCLVKSENTAKAVSEIHDEFQLGK